MANYQINTQVLDTYAPKTWCPGCFNFVIERVAKETIIDLKNSGIGFK